MNRLGMAGGLPTRCLTFNNSLIYWLALAPIFLGHPGKAQDSEFSGSTAWENTANALLPRRHPSVSERPAVTKGFLLRTARRTNLADFASAHQASWRSRGNS